MAMRWMYPYHDSRRRLVHTAMLGGAAAILMSTGAAQATGGSMAADLRGGQENPPISTPAMGCGRFLIDTENNTLEYRIVFAGIASGETAAHIHGPADPGNNAGIKHALPPGSPKIGVWNYNEADENDILAGKMYVNVHSNAFPSGEIRGQIVSMVSRVDSANEVPSNGSTGTAWGAFNIDIDANTLSYYIAIDSPLGSAETNAHIHGFSVQGDPAGVQHGLGVGSPKIGVWNYDEADEEAILQGRTYVNIHSANFPGGEIRGQIVANVNPIDGLQESPPNGSAGAGCAHISYDPSADLLGYSIYSIGLSGNETAAHIHGFAPPGANAGVQHPLPAGTPKVGQWNYPAGDEADILDGLTYVNIHTDLVPSGEIRGQIRFPAPKDETDCPADLDGDGDVDAADLARLLGNWIPDGYKPCPPTIAADLDGDCDVDAGDLAMLLGAWGLCD